MPIIDIHTHSLSEDWLNLVKAKGKPDLLVGCRDDGSEYLIEFGTRHNGFLPAHFDYDQRILDMNSQGIDVSVVSLTSPNAFWGTPEVSLECAQIMNDNMAAAQTAYPDRIRFFATIPWEYPDLAASELARAAELGAVGVMTLANIRRRPLNDPTFEPVWRDIENRGLPVLIHPTTPPGSQDMDLNTYGLLGPVGFLFDTTLAIARMIHDGFLDRFPEIKIIASHAGGYLPYIYGRMDLFFNYMKVDKKITEPPSEYLRRIYYDSIIYQADGMECLLKFAGADRVLFGTDYPHPADIPKLKELVDGLPTDQSKQVYSGAAERIFNF